MWCHMGKVTYDAAIASLVSGKNTTDCNTVLRYLKELGYEVDKCAGGNHYTFTNVRLDYYGGNFDCGHGRNPSVLPVYISKIIKVLKKHKDEIKELNKEED
jgi:hypothetical protein